MNISSPVVFPLFGILPDGSCACGRRECGRIGKHPRVAWRDLQLGDPVERPTPGAGFGLKTGAGPDGSGVFVVDLDGAEAEELFDELGGSPQTFEVYTPRGSHLYFQYPDFRIKNSAGELGKGIDIRGEGGFVVGWGSPHASGGTYKIARDVAPIPAPGWLLEWLRRRPEPASVKQYPGDVTDAVERARRKEIYAKYLATDAPPRGPERRGQGDSTLYEVVQYGAYDLALPSEDVLELVREHYDPRCSPPWGGELEERVLYKADYAKTKSTRERKVPLSAQEVADLEWVLPAMPLDEPSDGPSNFGFKVQWGGWDVEPQPPTFLVDGLLMEGKVTMIFADPGSIKSWTALDLASCVSQGTPWLNERGVKQGKVLYVDYEDGQAEFHRRVHLLTHGSPRPHLGYVYHPGRLDDAAIWKRLTQLQGVHDIRLVVIDTYAGGTSGVDENDRNAAQGLQAAGDFTEATGASVLVLHHSNRSGAIRGTNAFTANVDTLFKLETIKSDDIVHQSKLICVKSGQKKLPPILLEFTDDGLRRAEKEMKPEAPAVEENSGKDKRTLADLRSEILLAIQTQGPIASKEMIRELVKARAATVVAVVAELEKAGEIVKSPEGWIRDCESLREERLRDAIQTNPDWPRGKLLAHTYLSVEQFERMRGKGLFNQRSPDPHVVGFAWSHA